MKKNDLIYLEHIFQNLTKIKDYTLNVNFESFKLDEQKQDAVIRKIEVVGEASKKVSKFTKEKYSNIPWKAIAGMRDKLIHDYFSVDITMVWKTALEDVGPLILSVKQIIDDLENSVDQ